jgi:hypothetical protein
MVRALVLLPAPAIDYESETNLLSRISSRVEKDLI